MKQYTYTGLFIGDNGNTYSLEVSCNGFIQAFFLLTADAIRSGRHYQLNKITAEDGEYVYVDDIGRVSELL